MYQIAINDPMAYMDGETYAREHYSSLEELVNKYVVALAEKIRSRKKCPAAASSEAEEYQQALAYVKSLVVKGGPSVPADENGLDALVEKKYAL